MRHSSQGTSKEKGYLSFFCKKKDKPTTYYVKLADAYAAEKEAIGTFQQIGYVPPGTKQDDNSYKTTTFGYSETHAGSDGAYTNEVWTATAQGKMNDCASSSTWTVTTTLTSAENTATTGTLTHVAAVNGGDACSVLTPSFTNIGNSAAAANP